MDSLAWLLGVGGAAYACCWLRVLLRARTARAAELAGIRRAADADVTLLGEQLSRLDAELADRTLDASARADYWRALDAYERAKRDAARLRDPDAVRELVELLESGRHALACVRARVTGQALPAPGLPCFFNPEHGASVTVVEWRPPRRGTHTLPACRQCVTRLSAGAPLEVHTVVVGSRRVPYWEVCSHRLPHRETPGVPSVSATGPYVRWVWDTALSGDVDLGHYVDGGPRTASPPISA